MTGGKTVCAGSVESVKERKNRCLIKHTISKEGRRHPLACEATLSFGNTLTAKRALLVTVKDDLNSFRRLNGLRTSFLVSPNGSA